MCLCLPNGISLLSFPSKSSYVICMVIVRATCSAHSPLERKHNNGIITRIKFSVNRSRWPRDLRNRSADAWLLGSRVRFLFGAWMFVSYVYMLCSSCVCRGLCDGLITPPEKSYRVSNCVIKRTSICGQGKPQQ
jgi:hypothetical protein